MSSRAVHFLAKNAIFAATGGFSAAVGFPMFDDWQGLAILGATILLVESHDWAVRKEASDGK
jgi:hypothetical protein